MKVKQKTYILEKRSENFVREKTLHTCCLMKRTIKLDKVAYEDLVSVFYKILNFTLSI